MKCYVGAGERRKIWVARASEGSEDSSGEDLVKEMEFRKGARGIEEVGKIFGHERVLQQPV